MKFSTLQDKLTVYELNIAMIFCCPTRLLLYNLSHSTNLHDHSACKGNASKTGNDLDRLSILWLLSSECK